MQIEARTSCAHTIELRLANTELGAELAERFDVAADLHERFDIFHRNN